jgi:hypothetical protein
MFNSAQQHKYAFSIDVTANQLLPTSVAPAVVTAASLPPDARRAGTLHKLQVRRAVRKLTGWELASGSQELTWVLAAQNELVQHMRVGGSSSSGLQIDAIKLCCAVNALMLHDVVYVIMFDRHMHLNCSWATVFFGLTDEVTDQGNCTQ